MAIDSYESGKYAYAMKNKMFNNKNSKQFRLKLFGLISALVVLFLVIFVFVLGQNISKWRYGNDAKASFNTELSTLGPLSTFGLKKTSNSKCITEAISQYNKPQLQCSVSEDPYIVIGKSVSSKNHFVAQAAKLDNLLKKNGWTETANATPTIKQWFEGITSGKDWYPDEGAYKNIGASHCSIDFFLAFSNPKPPAFNLQASCTAPILQKYKNQLL